MPKFDTSFNFGANAKRAKSRKSAPRTKKAKRTGRRGSSFGS